MPLHRSRAVHLMVGLALLGGLVAVPGPALGARPGREAQTWIVTLRATDGRDLPAARGGLVPAATAIARRRAAATSRTIDTLQAQVGFQASQRYTYAVNGFAASLTAVQLGRLRADRRVLSLRPARPVELAGQVIPTSVRRVDAPPGGAPAASDDVSVAVVDTGVGHYERGAWRHAHELNVVGGVNAYADNGVDCAQRAPDPTKNPGSFDDTNSHGTHVAGTIGAIDNGIGAVGVAPGVKLYSVRVFDGVDGSDATVICGLDWIAAWNANHAGDESMDIDVVNMSLRGPAPPTSPTGCGQPDNPDPEELAVCAVIQSGASVVVAAGNETDAVSNYIPSRYADVITVSAISDFDGIPGGLAPESCVPPRGTETDDAFSLYSNFGPEVDIAAPGTCVRSTALSSEDGTSVMSGTSMATPHVTGAIARYLALDPATSPATMARLLVASATLDWDAATDPDDIPDRLVDVDALVSSTQGLAVWTVPQELTISGGRGPRRVRIRLQRIGGYAGPVTLDVQQPLPAGVASAGIADPTIPAEGLGRTLTLTLDPHPGDGQRRLTIHAVGDNGGPIADAELALRFDATPPTIGAPWPQIVLLPGTWSSVAPVRLRWSASDGQGALARQDLQRSRPGGGWSSYSRPSPAARKADASMVHRTPTRWRIKASDLAGNVAASDPLATRLIPTQAGKATFSEGWTPTRSRTASLRDLITTRKRWQSASLSFTGRAVGLVAPTGVGRGRISIRVDGAMVAIVDLSGTFAAPRRIVFASHALTPGPHTIKVTTLGGLVDLDAFLVLE